MADGEDQVLVESNARLRDFALEEPVTAERVVRLVLDGFEAVVPGVVLGHSLDRANTRVVRARGVRTQRLRHDQIGLRVGGAPDTFLGAGGQTARKTLDAGTIGRPVAGTAFMCGHGHESWHPNPAFYYDIGGGPMLDMGPYYITALVNILGPVKRVAGITTKAFEERIATSEARAGLRIPVKVTTHLTGVMEFANGAIITMIMSFDMWRHSLPCIEIYGTEGSMKVPDPNGFGGPVAVAPKGGGWEEFPLAFPNNARMIGVVDMARAIRSGRPHRASGDLTYHVLELMTAFDKSSQTGQHTEIQSMIERPAPFPEGLDEWTVDN